MDHLRKELSLQLPMYLATAIIPVLCRVVNYFLVEATEEMSETFRELIDVSALTGNEL